MARADRDNCGCCAGVDQETPVKLNNLPSQTTIAYRIGTHSKFKESMLAALTNARRPALLPLGTRDDDDFTIAYLDGVATMLEIARILMEDPSQAHPEHRSAAWTPLPYPRVHGYKAYRDRMKNPRYLKPLKTSKHARCGIPLRHKQLSPMCQPMVIWIYTSMV